MITWLALKAAVSSAWSSFTSFCKERWELLVGALVGILGMLALANRGGKSDKEHLQEIDKAKEDFQKELIDAKDKEIADILEIEKANLEKIAEIEVDFKEKINALSEEKKKLVRDHQESGRAPEELAKILGLKLK